MNRLHNYSDICLIGSNLKTTLPSAIVLLIGFTYYGRLFCSLHVHRYDL